MHLQICEYTLLPSVPHRKNRLCFKSLKLIMLYLSLHCCSNLSLADAISYNILILVILETVAKYFVSGNIKNRRPAVSVY